MEAMTNELKICFKEWFTAEENRGDRKSFNHLRGQELNEVKNLAFAAISITVRNR